MIKHTSSQRPQETADQKIAALLLMAEKALSEDLINARKLGIEALHLAQKQDLPEAMVESLYFTGETYEDAKPAIAARCYQTALGLCKDLYGKSKSEIERNNLKGVIARFQSKLDMISQIEITQEELFGEVKETTVEEQEEKDVYLNKIVSLENRLHSQELAIQRLEDRLSSTPNANKAEFDFAENEVLLKKAQKLQASINKVNAYIQLVQNRHGKSLTPQLKNYLSAMGDETDKMRKQFDELIDVII